MNTPVRDPPGLPFPKWVMGLIAIPTFYMPVGYLACAVWAIFVSVVGGPIDPPSPLRWIVGSAIAVTFILWPFYILWVAICRQLNWKEKFFWVLVVVTLNMVGMPMFYIFVTRRHLGLEQRTAARDEWAAESLLNSYGVERSALSMRQWQILVQYCRRVRLNRWLIVPWLVLAALALYAAAWMIPGCVQVFSDMVPVDTVFINVGKGTSRVLSTDPEAREQFVWIVLMAGASAGVVGSIVLFGLARLVSEAWTSSHRKTFLEFLRGTDKD